MLLPPGDRAALARGVATIYQELDLVDDLSVADNLFLGHELRGPVIDRRAMRAAATDVLGRSATGASRPAPWSAALPRRPSRWCPSPALTRRARLLIMDEPTAVLGSQEVDTLFDVIRRLTAEGVGVVYISHRLEEAAVADVITVLRDGRTVAAALPGTARAELITAMVGRELADTFPERDPDRRLGPWCCGSRSDGRRPCTTCRSTCARRDPRDRGPGGGRPHGAAAARGRRRPPRCRPSSWATGPPARSPRSRHPGRRRPRPEERKTQGLWPGWSLVRNVSVADLRRFRRRA